jgi:hypothetical protein
MKVDLEFLKIKKELLVREAEKLLEIQDNAGPGDHSYLVRSLACGPDHIKGNLPFTFVQRCIDRTDDIYDLLMSDIEQHTRCSIKLNTNVIEFWQKLDRKYKKLKPERGDIIVGHYNRQDKVVMNGMLGIVKSVDANLNMEIIEASVINIYDDESRAYQFDGIKLKVKALAGKGKCRILGVFTPWFF